MAEAILIAQAGDSNLSILPRMANRHGLIAGATGTGKTVTLQRMAEGFSRSGIPVFMADVKGDLSGMSQAGGGNAKVAERVTQLGLGDFVPAASPVAFWDVFGGKGHPVRTTIAEMGPLLLSRMLNLNEVQTGVIHAVFRIADDHGWLLLDLKDFRAMLQHVAENSADYSAEYGNISKPSVGAVQRAILRLESEGAEHLFGEPALSLNDFMRTDEHGLGMVNILAADSLYHSPGVYSTLLLWMLSELFEQLPEAGDLDQPKLVFFFDEAHLLFDQAPDALLDKIEQVVRLIRSKGVGVYFVSQNPLDIPDVVLGQLGNRVQHALRAFTPRDRKAVNAAAETFRPNPKLNVAQAITELGVGEALVSFLDNEGIPTPVERALVCPPQSRIGPATDAERVKTIRDSAVYGRYEHPVDRESAYEILKGRAAQSAPPAQESKGFDWGGIFGESQGAGSTRKRKTASRRSDTVLEAATKSAMRSIGSELGKQLARGLLGSLIGKRR